MWNKAQNRKIIHRNVINSFVIPFFAPNEYTVANGESNAAPKAYLNHSSMGDRRMEKNVRNITHLQSARSNCNGIPLSYIKRTVNGNGELAF